MGRAVLKRLENEPSAPANDDALVGALIAFANGADIVIYGQGTHPSGEESAEDSGLEEVLKQVSQRKVSRWSPWHERPNPDERPACADLLAQVIENPRGSLYPPVELVGYVSTAELVGTKSLNLDDAPALFRVCQANPMHVSVLILLMTLRGSVKFKPVIRFASSGYSFDVFRYFEDVFSALWYATMLVIDQSKPYSKLLSRCKFCGKFYLAKKNPRGGPANRTYCSPKHRDRHHNSAERKAADAARRKHK